MKYTVAVLACLVAAACAQFAGQYTNQYNNGQYNNGQYNPYNPFGNNPRNRYNYKPYTTPAPYRTYRPVSVTPVTFAPSPYPVTTPAPRPTAVPISVARVVSDDRNAETLRFGNEINPDSSFNYFFETSNGIAAQEQGVPRDFGGNPPVVPVVAQGSFSWISPEGKNIAISYTADENGYQPAGDALPTPPPLPAQIARALDYIARTAPQN